MKFYEAVCEIAGGEVMEITRIDETKHTLISQELEGRSAGCKVCLYYPEMICTLPKLRLRICQGCPRAMRYVRKNVMRSLFEHIKALAISLIKNLNIQLSK